MPPPCSQGSLQRVRAETGHCYAAFFTLRSWSSAEGACEQLGPGSHLATLLDRAELEFVGGMLGVAFGDTELWTGGRSLEAGGWEWVTGEPLDPAVGGGTNLDWPGCVVLYRDTSSGLGYTWKDRACDTPRAYVCESDSGG